MLKLCAYHFMYKPWVSASGFQDTWEAPKTSQFISAPFILLNTIRILFITDSLAVEYQTNFILYNEVIVASELIIQSQLKETEAVVSTAATTDKKSSRHLYLLHMTPCYALRLTLWDKKSHVEKMYYHFFGSKCNTWVRWLNWQTLAYKECVLWCLCRRERGFFSV